MNWEHFNVSREVIVLQTTEKEELQHGEAIKTSFIGSLGIHMSAECSSMGLRILTHLGLFQETFPTETNL